MRRKELSILILLLVLCAIVALMNPQFLSSANIQNTSRLIGTYGIFSIGLGIVIITGGIDLSVGSMFALLSVILAVLVNDHKWNWVAGTLVMVAVAVALGILHGFWIAKVRLQPFIVTLCGLLVYRGLGRAVAYD